MKCVRCGGETAVLETRRMESFMTNRRQRECVDAACRHRFMTVEVYGPAWTVAKAYAAGLAKTLRRRWALLQRDKTIAGELHNGWEALARRYKITRSAVYLAAQRGRQKERKRS